MLAAAAFAGQDKPPIPPVPGGAAPKIAPAAGVDLKPGELPADTSAPTRDLWGKVVAASLPGSGAAADRAPVSAFDLSLDLRYRASDAQSNEMPEARYRWLAPGFVRADTGRGYTRLRGPNGSYGIDSTKPGDPVVIPSDVSRDTLEDRRQLDEIAGLAANFAHLTDPRSLRIARLATIAPPLGLLPASVHERAQELKWLELESPDLSVMRATAPGPRLARVQLGVDASSFLVELALVDDAAAPARIGESTAVLQLSKYKTVDGFAVPHHIAVWLPELGESVSTQGAVLRPQPAMDMYVTKASLRPHLEPRDFLP